MQWFRMILTLSLLFASAPVSAQQTSYVLTVPVHQSVPASLTRMREVLTALHATFGTEATLGYVTATFAHQRRNVSVIPNGASIDQTTLQATALDITWSILMGALRRSAARFNAATRDGDAETHSAVVFHSCLKYVLHRRLSYR